MAQTSYNLTSYGGNALNFYTTVSVANFQRTYTNAGNNVTIFDGMTNPLSLVNGQSYNFEITAVAGTSQAGTPPFAITNISASNSPYNSSTNPLAVGGSVPCFLKGTLIRCADGDVPIEDLKKGDMVKTIYHGDVAVDMIGYCKVHHNRANQKAMDQLFTYKNDEKTLTVTGSHCLLLDSVTAVDISNILANLGSIYVTDDKIRLPACIDPLAKPYEKEESDEVVYHICLEHSHANLNYGIYANDILMETCPKACMENNMTICE